MSNVTTAVVIPLPVNSESRGNQMNQSKKAYKKPAANDRALTQVNAWLKAANVIAKPSEVPGCDLSVQGKNGVVEVKVAISYDEPAPAAEALVVLACELTSKHTPTALKAFHAITVAAGHGTPNPIAQRGIEPKKKLHYDDNFELVSFRHREFRKVPNPSAEELKQYEPVMKKAVSRFLYINKIICSRQGVEFDDLMTYAQVWTCTYLGLYKVANPTVNDNERKLWAFLCQRFAEFASMLVKKEKNCVVDSDTATIALRGTLFHGKVGTRLGTAMRSFDHDFASFEEHVEAELEAEVGDGAGDDAIDMSLGVDPAEEAAEEAKAAKISDNKRRKAAQSALSAELAALPHDRMVEILDQASHNKHLCYDAQKEAQRQLRGHREDCALCAASASKA